MFHLMEKLVCQCCLGQILNQNQKEGLVEVVLGQERVEDLGPELVGLEEKEGHLETRPAMRAEQAGQDLEVVEEVLVTNQDLTEKVVEVEALELDLVGLGIDLPARVVLTEVGVEEEIAVDMVDLTVKFL